ncbi:MAG: hypothetical protein JJU13_10505 [Balneolaceae bacterium]|nr:hypothetical protein [Balneolaceae bacterium]
MLTKNYNPAKLLKAVVILVIFILAIFHQNADAQQMFVDDAEVTTCRSFQIESWYGSRESWLLTAISPVRGLELGTGLGFDSRDGFDPANWILEAKFVPGDLEANGWAIGGVAGLLYDLDGDIEEVFAYIPYSQMIFNDSSVLHINAGIEGVQEEEWEYELITGIRGDFGLTDRFAILTEVAAANFSDAFYQGGIRISLVPDLLEMDITYGEGFRRQETAPGFNIGIAFTPDRLW